MVSEYSFDPKQFKIQNQYNARQEKLYGDKLTRVMNGYITAITDSDILEERYSVFIPELQITVRASVLKEFGSTQTNGSGYKPFAPEIGTPVQIHFLQESNQAVILGTINYSGLSYGAKILGSREFPNLDQKPLWRSITTNNLTDLGIDSQVSITPLDIRTISPIYGEGVPAGTYVPGSQEVKSNTGVNYSFVATADVKLTPLSITKVQGILKDYQDKALEVAYKEAEGYKAELEKSIRRNFNFVNGLIIPDAPLQLTNTLAGYAFKNRGLSDVLNKIDQSIGLIKRVATIGDQVVQWASQEPAIVIEDLLQTFGQLDLDLGLVRLDLNLSLTKIDVNLDFRIGTGVPQVDSVINTVLNTAVNSVLDNLLKNFKLGEVLGLDLSVLTGSQNSIDTKKTYVHNIFTPVLRMTNTKPSENTPDLKSILGNVSSILKFEDSNYSNPQVVLKTTSAKSLTKLELLSSYIFLVSSDSILYYLPNYLNQLYLYKSEKDLIGSLMFAATNQEDLLRLAFLYGYYSQSKSSLVQLLGYFIEPVKVDLLINQYSPHLTQNYNLLLNLVEGEVYDPLDLDLNLLSNTLTNTLLKDSINSLISGNLFDYINHCITIRAKKDLRLDFNKYTRLKYLTNHTFPQVQIGFDNE